jgi:Putative GTPase activating protein for Arf/UBA/TS-N domain
MAPDPDRKDSSLNSQHQALLTRMQKTQQGNDHCADCDGKAPRWASVNIGAFLCISCSGVHRSIGTHISVVRSITLDTWTPRQVAHFVTLGNVKSAAVYEQFLPSDFRRPSAADTHSIERFIRDKYERKLWASVENGGLCGVDSPVRHRPAPSVNSHNRRPEQPYRQQYRLYEEESVGYQQTSRLGSSIRRHATPYHRAEAMKQILDMGFEPHIAARALEASNGDLHRAVEWVLENCIAGDSGYPGQQAPPARSVEREHPQSLAHRVPSADLLSFDSAPDFALPSAPAPPPSSAPKSALIPQPPAWAANADDWADFGAFDTALPQATAAAKPVAASARGNVQVLSCPTELCAYKVANDAALKPGRHSYAQSSVGQDRTRTLPLVPSPGPRSFATFGEPKLADAPAASPLQTVLGPSTVPPFSAAPHALTLSVRAPALDISPALAPASPPPPEAQTPIASLPAPAISPPPSPTNASSIKSHVNSAKSDDPFAGLASFALSSSKANADAKAKARAEAKARAQPPPPPAAQEPVKLAAHAAVSNGLHDLGFADLLAEPAPSGSAPPSKQISGSAMSLDDLLGI